MSSYDPEYYQSKKNPKKTILEFSLMGMNMPAIDTSDIEQVSERASLYFAMCAEEKMKAGLAGLCLWLGISTEDWLAWQQGDYLAEHKAFTNRVKTLLEAEIENRMLENRIAPVSGMFLLKSQFGYEDAPKAKRQKKTSAVRELPLNDVLRLAAGKKKEKKESREFGTKPEQENLS